MVICLLCFVFSFTSCVINSDESHLCVQSFPIPLISSVYKLVWKAQHVLVYIISVILCSLWPCLFFSRDFVCCFSSEFLWCSCWTVTSCSEDPHAGLRGCDLTEKVLFTISPPSVFTGSVEIVLFTRREGRGSREKGKSHTRPRRPLSTRGNTGTGLGNLETQKHTLTSDMSARDT